MPNAYFQFKQFRINQDKSAMKVCTDSCILGAFAQPADAATILDIGTGTGLLSLMLAQKSNGLIDAVEIEENAFEQAKENIKNSSWKDKIFIFHKSIQDFCLKKNKKYDYIICNPPFYSKQLKSTDLKKNIAHHSEELSLADLVQSVSTLLNETGNIIIMLPPEGFTDFVNLSKVKDLHLQSILSIKDNEFSPVFRVIGNFSFNTVEETVKEELIIKNNNSEYTNNFKELLKAYYLNF